MKKLLKDKKIIISLLILIAVLLISSVATYAYYKISSEGTGIQKTIGAKTATLGLTYEDGDDIISEDLISDSDLYLPVKVTNTGSANISYSIFWNPVTTNTIVGYANLTTQDSCSTLSEGCSDVRTDFTWNLYKLDSEYITPNDTNELTAVASGYLFGVKQNDNIKADIDISKNTTDYYVLHIHFENLNKTTDETSRSSRLQNYQLNKEFNGKISVKINNPIDLAVDGTLSQRLSANYNVANEGASIINGTTYLNGPSSAPATLESKVLNNISGVGPYLYRNNDGTYNEELLENHIRTGLISSGNITEEEYNSITTPFGGYVGLMKGVALGIVDTDDFSYVDGKSIADILTLQAVMENSDYRNNLELDLLFTKEMFEEIYLNNGEYNESLLIQNFSLALTDAGRTEMLNTINSAFGNVLNYMIALSSDSVVEDPDTGDISLKDGVVLPSLYSIFNDPVVKNSAFITNNYIRLNDVLYRVLSINSDKSLNLLSYDGNNIALVPYTNNIEDLTLFNNYGFSGISNSVFNNLVEGTSLEGLLKPVTTTYTMNNGGIESSLNYTSTIRLPSLEDIIHTDNNGTFLYEEDRYDSLSINYFDYVANSSNRADTGLKRVSINGMENGSSDLSLSDLYASRGDRIIKVFPMITINDINVKGAGLKDDPYYIENEVTSSASNCIKALLIYLKENSKYLDYNTYGTLPSYNFNYINNLSKFTSTSYGQIASLKQVSVALNDNGTCYYTNYGDDTIYTKSASGGCEVIIAPNISSHPSEATTTLNTAATFSVIATNTQTYQWQQYINNEWVDLANNSLITGVNTSTLSYTPNGILENSIEVRCKLTNYGVNIYSNAASLTLTGGPTVSLLPIYKTVAFAPVTMSATSNDADGFKWQQKINNNWITLSDIENRISGSNTSSITITETNDYDETSYYRCVAYNANGYTKATTFISLLRTDGDWVYTASAVYNEASGLYENSIKDYIGDYTDSYYFTQNNETPTMYNLEVPSIVNTDQVPQFSINEMYNSFEYLQVSTWNEAIVKVKEITFDEGINNINSRVGIFSDNYSGVQSEQHIEKVVIPSSVVIIGNAAFCNHPIKELDIIGALDGTSKLKYIRSYSFPNYGDTHNLIDIVIPASVEKIGQSAFFNSAKSLNIIDTQSNPSVLNTIDAYAFYNNSMQTTTLPASINSIGAEAFYYYDHSNIINVINMKRANSDGMTLSANWNAAVGTINWGVQ